MGIIPTTLRTGERKDLGTDDGGRTMHLAEVRQGELRGVRGRASVMGGSLESTYNNIHRYHNLTNVLQYPTTKLEHGYETCSKERDEGRGSQQQGRKKRERKKDSRRERESGEGGSKRKRKLVSLTKESFHYYLCSDWSISFFLFLGRSGCLPRSDCRGFFLLFSLEAVSRCLSLFTLQST